MDRVAAQGNIPGPPRRHRLRGSDREAVRGRHVGLVNNPTQYRAPRDHQFASLLVHRGTADLIGVCAVQRQCPSDVVGMSVHRTSGAIFVAALVADSYVRQVPTTKGIAGIASADGPVWYFRR